MEIDRIESVELEPGDTSNGNIYRMYVSVFLDNGHTIKLELGQMESHSSETDHETGQFYIDGFEYY